MIFNSTSQLDSITSDITIVDETSIHLSIHDHPFGMPSDYWSYTVIVGCKNFTSSGKYFYSIFKIVFNL